MRLREELRKQAKRMTNEQRQKERRKAQGLMAGASLLATESHTLMLAELRRKFHRQVLLHNEPLVPSANHNGLMGGVQVNLLLDGTDMPIMLTNHIMCDVHLMINAGIRVDEYS
jgi:hypothetical protein